MSKDKQVALEKLEKRRAFTNARFESAKRFILSDKFSGEADREWLRSFAVGKGLDIACGDFPANPEAETADSNFIDVIPVDYFLVSADELTNCEHEAYDYVVTNYFECFPNPLKALNDWWRVLKPGGVLGIVCMNADTYKTDKGALGNKRRLNTFTLSTLKNYVSRAEFKVQQVYVNPTDKTIGIKAVK